MVYLLDKQQQITFLKANCIHSAYAVEDVEVHEYIHWIQSTVDTFITNIVVNQNKTKEKEFCRQM